MSDRPDTNLQSTFKRYAWPTIVTVGGLATIFAASGPGIIVGAAFTALGSSEILRRKLQVPDGIGNVAYVVEKLFGERGASEKEPDASHDDSRPGP